MLNFNALPKAKDWDGRGGWNYYQRKFDGIRCLLRRKDGDSFDAFTRNGLTDLWPMLKEACYWRNRIPEYTALDCEVYVPNVHATSVITHLKEHSSQLEIMPFAIPWLRGVDTRRTSLPIAQEIATKELWIPFANSVPRADNSVDGLLEMCRQREWEGVILKQEHYAQWWKLKPTQTMDLVVTGYSISTSDSFAGGLKAIQVSDANGTELASVGSGFETHYRMSVDPQTLLGRVAEIQFDSLAANGKLKFPRFVRWRDDK